MFLNEERYLITILSIAVLTAWYVFIFQPTSKVEVVLDSREQEVQMEIQKFEQVNINDDTTTTIQDELYDTDLGDLDKELADIESSLDF